MTETEYTFFDGPLNMHGSASNERTIVYEIQTIINKENVITTQEHEKILVLILSDNCSE